MRLVDILMLVAVVVVSLFLAIPATRSWKWKRRVACAVLLAGMLVAQVVLRRFYWQVLPADAACLVLSIACLCFNWSGTIHSRLAAFAALILAAISFGCLLVLPIFRLPRPTGPYAIGTRIIHLVDSSRVDNAFPSGKRELMVQVWYPAGSVSQPLAPYRRWKETTALSSYDAFLITHSHLDSPIARRGSPYPVLLFNPAWGGSRTQNTYQTEELASHGYIVIAIDHTHNSSLVAFPDGQVIKMADMQSIDDFTNSTFERQMKIGDQEVDTQAKDDIFVLDAFSAADADPKSDWFETLDLERIGIFGHSFGGATSVETCLRDPRVSAALNMDGWMYGEIGQRSLRKPLFVMYEEGWPPDAAEIAKASSSRSPEDRMNAWDLHNLYRTLAEGGGYLLTIQRTRHFNFSDRALYSPIRRLTDSGRIDPRLAHSIVNRYTLAFFDEALNNRHDLLLDMGRRTYSQVEFTRWNATSPAKGAAQQKSAN
jgi:dienelactone hydrolase